jgi:hypothetical protein
MAWNIQDLRIKKLNASPQDPNQERAAYIVDSVVRVNPAIFVVVEVETGWPAPGLNIGYVVTPTQGGPAVLDILARLRLAQPEPNHQWCLVPPLITGAGGKKEGVGVFFDNKKVNFRGPHQLDNTAVLRGRGVRQRIDTFQCTVGISPVPPPVYLGPWNEALPNEAPGGGPVGGQPRNQNQLAGKVGFLDNQGGELYFPTRDCRSPLLTSFWEVGPPNRTFNLLSVHLPPRAGEAGAAVANIMKIAGITSPLAPREVRVVLGDFNIDHRSEDQFRYLRPLRTLPIARQGGATHFELANFIGATQLRKVWKARPTGNPPYPDYVDHVFRGPRDELPAYDYIYVAYSEDPPDPTEAPFGRVIDRVIGTPWLGPEIAPAMQARWQDILDRPPLPPPGPTELFRQIQNYGKIRETSDHMAVYADL